MLATADIEQFKRELKNDLPVKGLGVTVMDLKQQLPAASPRFNELIHLESRLQEANIKNRKGILTNQELDLAYARLRDDLLTFIDSLQSADFQTVSPSKKSSRGSILYQIPTLLC